MAKEFQLETIVREQDAKYNIFRANVTARLTELSAEGWELHSIEGSLLGEIGDVLLVLYRELPLETVDVDELIGLDDEVPVEPAQIGKTGASYPS